MQNFKVIKNLTFLILILAMSALSFSSHAEKYIMLNLLTEDGQIFQKGELMVTQNDSTVLFEIIDTPQYNVKLQEAGEHKLTLSSLGYIPYETIIPDTTFMQLNIILEKEATTLGEFVVKGNSESEKTATGEIFTLSQKAKNSKNPYLALSEIPLLNVDVANQNVSLRDGSKALILIDGRMINSGISPIDPKFIDKVEVYEVVSAKYMNMGVTKIIDIRLKRNVPTYLYTELRTRHDIPLREGFGGANFEIGNKKFAVFGSVFESYMFNTKDDFHSKENLNGDLKTMNGINKSWSNRFEADIMMKWVPNSKDYFAFRIRGLDIHSKGHSNANGSYVAQANEMSLSAYTSNRESGSPFNTALFYEHTFSDKSTLSGFLRYQWSNGSQKDSYEEVIGEYHSDFYDFQKNFFENYSFMIDYNGTQKKFGSIAAGNELQYSSNRLQNHTINPIEKARVQFLDNYTYFTYNGSIKRMYYMASAGLMYMDINANGKRHSYWRPKVSASISFAFPKANTLRGSYQLQNGNPQINQLFVFNNSTNPWIIYEGNPYLVPIMTHTFDLTYTKQFGMNYLSFDVLHVRTDHMFETYLRNEGDYIIQSYRNHGTYNGTRLTPQFIFRYRHLLGSIAGFCNWDNYAGQSTKTSFGANAFVRWDFGQCFLYSSIAWQNKQYTEISTTKFHNPTQAQMVFTWRPNNNLNISAGMDYFWGIRNKTVYTAQDGYSSQVKTKFKGTSLRPYILISWTLYKHTEQAIDDKMKFRF